MFKKYNYFDDEPEFEESAFDKIKNAFVTAYYKIKYTFKYADGKNFGEKIKNVFIEKRSAVKIGALAAVVLAVVLCIVCFTANINSSNKKLKQYYSDAGSVCTQIISDYGSCKTQKTDVGVNDNVWSVTGLCYARQLDFDGDGKDELFVAYNNSGTFTVEVWGYDSGDFVKFFSDKASKGKDGGSFVSVYSHGGKYYLGFIGEEDENQLEMFGLKGNKFKKTSHTCQYDSEKDIYAVKGKINSTDFETVKFSAVSAAKAEKLVDMITKSLDTFVSEKAANAVVSPKSEDRRKAAAYYDVIEKRIEKYGKPFAETASNICYAGGVAVVRLIDFDADGNEELLVISRRETKSSAEDKNGESIVVTQPEYRLEVYGWQNGNAVKLYENNGLTKLKNQESNAVYYILQNNKNNTVEICNNSYAYGKNSARVWTGTSRIVALNGGEFETTYIAVADCDYGYMTYTLNGDTVYRNEFKEKGYEVPYFCTDDDYDDYDKSEFEVTKLQGGITDAGGFNKIVDETNKTISSLNSSYNPE